LFFCFLKREGRWLRVVMVIQYECT
jgi:hypothetical protein